MPERPVLRLPCAKVLFLFALMTMSATAGATEISREGRQIRDADQQKERALTVLYGRSFLDGGREDWDDFDLELVARLNPNLIVMVGSNARRREGETDVMYRTSLAYFPNKTLELHWGLALTPGADFSARQKHNIGLEWRGNSRVSVGLDLERLNYDAGPVDQVTPGVIFWLSEDDRTFFNAAWTFGHAFHDRYFDAQNLKLVFGLSGNRSLRFGYYHGEQPEEDPSVPGTLLLNSDIVSAYYHVPIREKIELIMGVEYEDLRDVYDRTTATFGVTSRF